MLLKLSSFLKVLSFLAALIVFFYLVLQITIQSSASSNLLFILPVYYSFQTFHFLFLSSPFLWFLCLFFMLLSSFIIITLNFLFDKLLAYISSSSSS